MVAFMIVGFKWKWFSMQRRSMARRRVLHGHVTGSESYLIHRALVYISDMSEHDTYQTPLSRFVLTLKQVIFTLRPPQPLCQQGNGASVLCRGIQLPP